MACDQVQMEKLKGNDIVVTLEEAQCALNSILIPFPLSILFYFCSFIESFYLFISY